MKIAIKVPRPIVNFFLFLAAFNRGEVDYLNRPIFSIRTPIEGRFEMPSPEFPLTFLQLGYSDTTISPTAMLLHLYALTFTIEGEKVSGTVDSTLYNHTGEVIVHYCVRSDKSIKVLEVEKA